MATTDTADEIEARVKAVMSRAARLQQRKANLAGQLQSKKNDMTALLKEIADAGYNPKTLTQDEQKARADLEAELTALEQRLDAAETALDMFDKK
jgi:uncharacterized protein YoxC